MSADHDGPATFAAEAKPPWAAWSNAMDQALLTAQAPATWPTLARPLRVNEEVAFVFLLRGHLERAQSLGADRCGLWPGAIAAVAPELRKAWKAQRAFQEHLWNVETVWGTRLDEGDNLGVLLQTAWAEPWAPNTWPRADEMSAWEQAQPQAPWAYHLAQAWLSSSRARGWGNEEAPVDAHPSPLDDLVQRVHARLADLPSSHWRTWAHHVALVRLAGMPQDPGMRQVANAWQLGWPHTWQGTGLNAAALGTHLHARQAAVGHHVAKGRAADWLSPVEVLFSFAMDVHLTEDLIVPNRPPTWMSWLREALAVRQGQPHGLFKDATGAHGWATWQQQVQGATDWKLPPDFAPNEQSTERRRLWNLQLGQKMAMWQALVRVESAHNSGPATPEETLPAQRRHRRRT